MEEGRSAELLRLATELLGSEALALKWIESPARGLDGATAIGLSATEEGFEQVKILVLQLEHGVYI